MERLATGFAAHQATVIDGIRRYRALLASPLHRTLIGASALSDIGDWLNVVAITILAYQLGDGLMAVGFMLALRKLPGLLFQLPAGTLIDRMQGPSVLIASQLLLAAIAGGFGLLLRFQHLWLLLLLVFLLETVNVVTFPAFRSAIARWTAQDHRGTATALLTLEDTLAWMIGPVLGGIMLAAWGAGPLFITNALTYIVVAGAVFRVWQRRSRDVIATMHDETDEHLPVAADRVGSSAYRAMLRRKDLLGYGVSTIIGTMIMQGMIAIAMLRADALGFGKEGFGAFYATLAIGSLFGGLIAGLGRYVRGSVLILVAMTEFLNAVGFGLFAVLPTALLVLPILALTGATTELSETPALTYFQNTLPEEVFGRFFSLFLLAVKIGALLGLLLVPWLGLRIGPENALLALCAIGAVFALGFGLWARQWTREGSMDGSLIPPATSEQPAQKAA